MKIPILDSVPAWFKLEWKPEEHALQVHIAKAFIATQRPIPKHSPGVAVARNNFPHTLFTSFCGNLSEPFFGFNQHIRKIDNPASKQFVSFSVSLPRIHIETGMVCQECAGTTKRNHSECFSCDGTGKEYVNDWNIAFEVTTSLWLLFLYLKIIPEQEMPTAVPQWLDLTLCAERCSHGSSLGGHLSLDGLRTFETLAKCKEKRQMIEARISTSLTESWQWMMGKREHDLIDLRAEITETPNLGLTVPGDATGVYTENQGSNHRSGCEIGCHNMDNPAQALATLVGLAVFSESLEEVWRDTLGKLIPWGHNHDLKMVRA